MLFVLDTVSTTKSILKRPLLVTGGCGFIGSNFILDWLQQEISPIINLDLMTYAGQGSHLDSLKNNYQYTFVHGDICNAELVFNTFKKFKPAAIIHFAAESHVDRSIQNASNFIKTNVLGTYTLLEIAKDYYFALSKAEQQNFIFLNVSTDEVYGSLESSDPAFIETNQYLPNSPYAASKASADHLVRAWHSTFGLPVITTNCSNNYGAFQNLEKLIPLIITNALAGKQIPIYGDGKNIRDWIYVKDHCAALRLCLHSNRSGEHYNIGGGEEKSNLQIAYTICEILEQIKPTNYKYADLIKFVPDRPGHDKRYAVNYNKIKSDLSWQPIQSFKQGILKTVNWYIENYANQENITVW